MKSLLSCILFFPILCIGQLGGQTAYQTLNLTTNPRAAALGSSVISLNDGDISQFFENPATLDSVSSGAIFFHFNPYFADVSVYSLAYGFDVKDIKGFAIGINYVNFGSFQLRDDSGAEIGDFAVNDYTITLGKSHRLGPFILGANLKLVNSTIDSYSTTALLMDIGGVFQVSKNWSFAMVFENFGARLSSFTAFDTPTIPFDVKIGTSFKPEYMPIRFTLTTNNLVSENAINDVDGNGRSNDGVNKVLKRINIGAELLLSDHLHLLFAYNHKRKQELSLEEKGAGAGFSFGMMAGVKQFQIRYSRAIYHAAGGSSFISVQTNLNHFRKIL